MCIKQIYSYLKYLLQDKHIKMQVFKQPMLKNKLLFLSSRLMHDISFWLKKARILIEQIKAQYKIV